MVRQRKSHTRVKRGPAAQAEVLSGDGQPDEGETGEGSCGAWEEGGATAHGAVPERPGCELTVRKPEDMGRKSFPAELKCAR
jgi:hypothetical protein